MDQGEHLESKEALRRRMNEMRYSMAQTVGEIRHEFSDGFSWETYIQRYPGTCLLIAGGVGWMLGSRLAGIQERSAAGRNFVAPPAGEPSSVAGMAELIASSVFAQVVPLLAEKMKQVFQRSSPSVRE